MHCVLEAFRARRRRRPWGLATESGMRPVKPDRRISVAEPHPCCPLECIQAFLADMVQWIVVAGNSRRGEIPGKFKADKSIDHPCQNDFVDRRACTPENEFPGQASGD